LTFAAVNWSEVTAIATSLLAVGLLGGFAAALFAAQQAKETRRTREAQMAAEFFRRWDEDALVEARRLVARFKSADELRDAFAAYVADDAAEAFVLYRELDFFEQLAALEQWGAFDIGLVKMLMGRTLVERWEMWKPAIEKAHGQGVYPLFEGLAEKLRHELDVQVKSQRPGGLDNGTPELVTPRRAS
jgi:phosphate/sulfate permease